MLSIRFRFRTWGLLFHELVADFCRWLAMLLGRYRLDIVTAMCVYMDIAEAIEPKRKRERAASKYKFHSRLDQHKLVAKIEEILEKKNLDPMLFDRNREARIQQGDGRCHYASVVPSHLSLWL
jgi:hypothetical protein